MSQPLPTGKFEWMSEEELTNWRDISCFLEVNIRYPVKLHDLHNEYPLIPNLNDKENYVLHSRNLKFYIENGLVITGVRCGIKFEESPWLAKRIQLNTNLKTKASSEFEKNLVAVHMEQTTVRLTKPIYLGMSI